MKYLATILFLTLTFVSKSQTFINRAGAANTVIDARLGASQNFYLPRLADTTLSGGKDTVGNLIYDRLRAKIWIRDTVLAGGHKFTQLFKEDDTASVIATKYDLSLLTNDNISNASLTADGQYAQNWSENQWFVDSIAGQFLFRMGGVGNTGTRRKEFRINWGGSAFGDQMDAFNMLASIKKADLSADSLRLGLLSGGTGVLSMGAYDVANSANNTFISYSLPSGLIHINARDSIWIKGATPAATADSMLAVVYRTPTTSRIVKIPLSAVSSAIANDFIQNQTAVLQNATFAITGPVKIGTIETVDPRLKVLIRDSSTATGAFAAIEIKTINDDEDLNVDGAVIVKHDSAYNLTPGYGNTLQVYTLAGSAGTIIGNNNFVGVTTPYTPGENEVSNGFIRFELGPIWPKSEKMRLNNRGEIIFGWTKVRSHLASQTGTTVNDPVNSFSASDVGKFFCWGDRELGGTAAFADRITGYIDANNITVETSRTIASQGGRVCYANAIVDTLGNALFRYVSLDSIKFATGDETAFFKFKPIGDTLRLVREGTPTDAAFDATTGITVARLPRDVHLMGSTYSKLHFRDATHTLADITSNSTATTITTLDNLPINFNPNSITSATIASTKVQSFKPIIISATPDVPIGELDVRNPSRNISAYIENTRGTGTNFAVIADVTGAGSENRALYGTANGGSVNKGIMVPSTSGSGANDFGLSVETAAKNYFAGKVGVNITAPVWGLDVQRSIGANKDSITIIPSIGSNSILVIDTTNGKFQRINSLPSSTIIGTTTNDNAVAGNIGEYIESNVASGSAVSLTTATAANITSISLTAGDWDVEGIINYVMTGATTANFSSGSNSTSATLGGENTFTYTPFSSAGLTDQMGNTIPTRRFSLSGTTTIYLVGKATFSVGSVDGYGLIRARRVR